MKNTSADASVNRKNNLGSFILGGLVTFVMFIFGVLVGREWCKINIPEAKNKPIIPDHQPEHQEPVQSLDKITPRVQTRAPNPIVQDMYLEITNVAQGANIGFLVGVVAVSNFYATTIDTFFSLPFLAFTDLLITVIFWTRYYFDTQILRRSYRVISTIWFFIYLTTQGIGILFVTEPYIWLGATGVFLLFASGFYALNLMELSRKNKRGVLPLMPAYRQWQARRFIDLLVVGILSVAAAFLVYDTPELALPASVFSLGVAIWQVILNGAYRSKGFIYTGP